MDQESARPAKTIVWINQSSSLAFAVSNEWFPISIPYPVTNPFPVHKIKRLLTVDWTHC